MTQGNNAPFGINPSFGPGYPYPPYYAAGFSSVLAAMSAGVLPANIQVSGASSPGGGNPTLLAAMSQGLQINGVNGISAPVNANGGGAPAFVPANALANVPSFNGANYGGN